MWTFRKKQPTTDGPIAATPQPAKSVATGTTRSGVTAERGVLIAPYLTEHASVLADRGQYTFLVHRGAEKTAIARAITARYGVHPVRVATIRVRGKVVRTGRTTGRRSDRKKAIVTLRAGEKIPFGVKT